MKSNQATKKKIKIGEYRKKWGEEFKSFGNLLGLPIDAFKEETIGSLKRLKGKIVRTGGAYQCGNRDCPIDVKGNRRGMFSKL